MTGPDLTAAKRLLAEQGWCVVPGVLDAQATAHALERLHAAARASEQHGVSTFMPILDPNPSNVRVFGLIEHDALFRELVLHPAAQEMVASLIGDSFLISNFTANTALPGSQSMALHSDQALVAPEPWLAPWTINIIWCLSDVRFENGATLFVPGSHHWTSHGDVPADAADRLQPFVAKAGSFIAMDGRLWHTSGANVTADEERALLFGYYCKPFLRPQVNWNASLSAAAQAALSPELHARLGMGPDANSEQAAFIVREVAQA
jgi:ectoine hydroxylase-related dioxygenase (phytanoyl-CoA dioxygenase family)